MIEVTLSEFLNTSIVYDITKKELLKTFLKDNTRIVIIISKNSRVCINKTKYFVWDFETPLLTKQYKSNFICLDKYFSTNKNIFLYLFGIRKDKLFDSDVLDYLKKRNIKLRIKRRRY